MELSPGGGLGCDQSVHMKLPPHDPLFIKVALDFSPDKLAHLANIVLATSVDGLVVSNTTNARTALLALPRRDEAGDCQARHCGSALRSANAPRTV